MTNKWDPNSYRNRGIDMTGAAVPAQIEYELYNKDPKIWDLYHNHQTAKLDVVFLETWRNEVTLVLKEALDEANETTTSK